MLAWIIMSKYLVHTPSCQQQRQNCPLGPLEFDFRTPNSQSWADHPLWKLKFQILICSRFTSVFAKRSIFSGKMSTKDHYASRLWSFGPNFCYISGGPLLESFGNWNPWYPMDHWQPLKAFRTFINLQQPLATFDNLWEPFKTIHNLWQPLVTFGNLWQPLATFGNIWQPLATFDNLR